MLTELLVDNIICDHGVPEELILDCGANLLSAVITKVCEVCGMKKINTTAYYPQTDSLVKNFKRILRGIIVKYCDHQLR